MTRRVLAVAVLAASLLVAVLGSGVAHASGASPIIRSKLLGHSVDGRPIIAYELGDPYSRKKALILGEMHGDEPAGVTLVRSILHEKYAVTGMDLWVIPTMNPDGYALHTRQNARGVDLNRNWPDSWRHLTGQYYSGPHALSEPETRAMYAFLNWLRPHYLVSLHQPLQGVDTTDGGATHPAFRHRLADNLGLPEKAFRCWSVCHGSMTGWFTRHLPGAAITVEFGWTPSDRYLTGRARIGIISAMGGGFAELATRNPIGEIGHAGAHGSTVHIAGWTLDPDMKGTALPVTLFDGPRQVQRHRTAVLRPLIDKRYATTGRHGYDRTFAATNGTHHYCVVYRNIGAGDADTRICRTVVVNGSPSGDLESASSTAGATAEVTGWAFDPDRPNSAITVRVAEGAKTIGEYATDVSRPDINSAQGITGNHGFDINLTNVAAGDHTYCVTALNVGSALAPNTAIGCRTVAVSAAQSTSNRTSASHPRQGHGGSQPAARAPRDIRGRDVSNFDPFPAGAA